MRNCATNNAYLCDYKTQAPTYVVTVAIRPKTRMHPVSYPSEDMPAHCIYKFILPYTLVDFLITDKAL